MAENKENSIIQNSLAQTEDSHDIPLKGAFSGVGFRHYYVDGVDLSGVDLVTDLARDLVCSTDRDYLFMCKTASASSSTYILVIADDISYDGEHYFTCNVADIYTFQVTVTKSVTYDSCSGSLSTSPATSFSYSSPVRTHFVNVVPSLESSDYKRYGLVHSDFYYSSETAFQLRTKSEEVNLLACIAFILAVIGCSLWFAAIFRNVQRR